MVDRKNVMNNRTRADPLPTVRALALGVACAITTAIGSLPQAGAAVLPEKTGKAPLARAMWSAFECTVFAEPAERHDEQRRLFEFGLQTGARVPTSHNGR